MRAVMGAVIRMIIGVRNCGVNITSGLGLRGGVQCRRHGMRKPGTFTGYFCQFKPHFLKKQDYTLQQVDLFAAGACPERKMKCAKRT
jgi:hypothetical protein